jgi:hypothetical protein
VLPVSSLILYDQVVPGTSFNHLGLPFDFSGSLDLDFLIARKAQSALSGMRGLQALGLRASSFSQLLSSKLYAFFIRSKFEYGLAISWFLKRHLKSLDEAQELTFGDHHTSTAVFKHITSVPNTSEHVHILVFKIF